MINRSFVFFFAFYMACATVSLAQSKNSDQPFIEVTGIAEEEILPNEIYISITLKGSKDSRAKTVKEKEEELKKALRDSAIPVQNLYLAHMSSDYIRVGIVQKEVIPKIYYTLKVSTASEVAKAFQIFNVLNINEAHISKVDHSEIIELRKNIRKKAIKAAKEKAEYLLSEIGENVGKALVVRENQVSGYTNNSNVNIRGGRSEGMGYFVDGVKSFGMQEVQFQKIKLQSSIYVKFQIAQNSDSAN